MSKNTKIGSILTSATCSPFADDATAIVLSKRRGASQNVKLRPIEMSSGYCALDYNRRIKETLQLALDKSALEIHDFPLIKLHDPSNIEVTYSLETIGVFNPGETGERAYNGETKMGGRGPVVNPSGGLVRRGHPVGATGLYQIAKLFEQLTNRAQKRQVRSPKLALSFNTGGMVSGDFATCVVSILESA